MIHHENLDISIALHPFSKRSSNNIPHKSTILERHRRTPKIRRLQRIPRHTRQTLPRNQRLLASLSIAYPHRMVNRPEPKISNPDTCASSPERLATVPFSMR